jgi:hypothetical protein
MNRRVLLGIAAVALWSSTVPVIAHHSFAAEFDSNRPLTVTGTVVRLEWTNPHARLVVEAMENGKPVVLGLRARSAQRPHAKRLDEELAQAGHKVTVSGFHSKTQPYIANARTVTLADGRQVFAGSSFDTGSSN